MIHASINDCELRHNVVIASAGTNTTDLRIHPPTRRLTAPDAGYALDMFSNKVIPFLAAGAFASAGVAAPFVSADIVSSTVGNNPVLTSYPLQPADNDGPGGSGCVNGQCGSGGVNGGPGGGPGGAGCIPTQYGPACGSGGVNAGPGGIPGGSGCIPGVGCGGGHG